MKAEILCIGTELLLGDTVNTNSAYISQKLADLGIDCYFHTAVGDNAQRITTALDTAFKRADILIVTGGLGPTDDDITMRTLADYFRRELVFDENSFEKIKNFFFARGRKVPEKAIKQAYFPEGANIINNPAGTAPGIFLEIENKIILSLPGVPDELYKMWNFHVEKLLKKLSDGVILKRFLKFHDIPEGSLGEKVRDLMQSKNPTVAPVLSEGQPNIRITAKSKTKEEARKSVNKMEKIILERIGEYCWGFDDETLEKVAGNLLLKKNLTVSVAESCTGGLVSSRLTDVSGSSAYIKHNVTTYSNEAKIKILGVDANLIKENGAVSEPVAAQMAKNIRMLAETDIGIGVTGIAGPTGGTAEKPLGLVYIGISAGDSVKVNKININPELSRQLIKSRASSYALNLLIKRLRILQ